MRGRAVLFIVISQAPSTVSDEEWAFNEYLTAWMEESRRTGRTSRVERENSRQPGSLSEREEGLKKSNDFLWFQ